MAAISIMPEDAGLKQAFDWERDAQVPVGHVVSLTIGTKVFTADFEVHAPLDDSNLKAVGIITGAEWAGGHGDFVKLTFNISTKNKQELAMLLHKELSNTSVKVKFNVYEYDPIAKKYYSSFNSTDAELEGIVLKDSGKLQLTLEKSPNETVKSPENYKVELSFVPEPKSQAITLATGDQQTVVKKWGIATG